MGRKNRHSGLWSRHRVIFLAVAIVTVVLVAGVRPSAADSPAVGFTSADVAYEGQLSLGWMFSTVSAITVTALGYYDYQVDGFLTPHEVGIFDSTGNLLTSVMLDAGTANPLDGLYRYASITPLTLLAGQSFVIAATSWGNSDLWAYGGVTDPIHPLYGFTVDPRISIDPNAALYVYESDDMLRYPTVHYGDYTIYGGPNFEIAPVPAPPSLILLAPVLLGLVGLRKRLQG